MNTKQIDQTATTRTGGHSAKNARQSGASNNHQGSGKTPMLSLIPRPSRSTRLLLLSAGYLASSTLGPLGVVLAVLDGALPTWMLFAAGLLFAELRISGFVGWMTLHHLRRARALVRHGYYLPVATKDGA